MNKKGVTYSIAIDAICSAFGASAAVLCGKVLAMADNEGIARLSLEYLCRLLHIDRRTLRSLIRTLAQAGLIEYEPSKGRGNKSAFKKGTKLHYFIDKKRVQNCTILAIPPITPLYNNINNNINNNNYIINEKENIILKERKIMAKFIKPTLQEVEEYCRERGNGIDAQHFIDYYDSKGWVVGKAPMKDWRAAVRLWEHNDKVKQQNQYNYGGYKQSNTKDAASAIALGIALADAERSANK